MHWTRPWPKNKSCYLSQVLQLLFWSHSHANTLSYSSTLVKLVSWKWHFKWNQHLEANLAYAMNTNIVPFIILDVSKVFWWPHNHLIHWSYMIASINIYIYIINVSCDNVYKCDEISYAHVHECLDDACAHEMQVSNAKLNTGVLQPLPPYRNIAPRFERPTIPHKRWDKRHINNPPVLKWHLVHCGYSTPPCRI